MCESTHFDVLGRVSTYIGDSSAGQCVAVRCRIVHVSVFKQHGVHLSDYVASS